MREVVLVMPCPLHTQAAVQCEMLARRLVSTFGGYSSYEGYGAYKTDDNHVDYEPHKRFVVGVVNEFMEKLAINLLREHARVAGEKAIYYVDTQGEVHIEDVGVVAKQAR